MNAIPLEDLEQSDPGGGEGGLAALEHLELVALHVEREEVGAGDSAGGEPDGRVVADASDLAVDDVDDSGLLRGSGDVLPVGQLVG